MKIQVSFLQKGSIFSIEKSFKEILETIPGNIQIVIRAFPAITEKEFTEINKILSESITKSIAKANV